jgi:hypothetical protein
MSDAGSDSRRREFHHSTKPARDHPLLQEGKNYAKEDAPNRKLAKLRNDRRRTNLVENSKQQSERDHDFNRVRNEGLHGDVGSCITCCLTSLLMESARGRKFGGCAATS